MAGVTAAVDTIVVQHVVVVVAALVADVGWGTAGVGWEKAGQVVMLPDHGQHTHTAVLTEHLDATTDVVAIVVHHVVVVVTWLVVMTGDDGDAGLKHPNGLMMFPSSSIFSFFKLKALAQSIV